MGTAETLRAVETVWRIESARLIAGLARLTHDLSLAEELAQEALEAALRQWPAEGVPRNPGAWLMAAGKRRAIDGFRRSRMIERKHLELAIDLDPTDSSAEAEIEAAIDDEIGDELLALIFTACHPVLSTEARVALTLRLIGGLSTEEIASAFLTSEATIAQRIVRAKKALAKAGVAYEVPRGAKREARLSSVLEVLYLIFGEGYAPAAEDAWTRPGLCDEAMRLGRVLAGLAPDEAEVYGLLALMELQASRLPTRAGPDGVPILLLDQDRSRWDRILIQHGLKALSVAENLAPSGPYTLQAAIAACHARALTAEATDWARIASLYDSLYRALPSPVVDLNRAVAKAMAFGPAVGLELVDEILADGTLDTYHLAHSVRGEFLTRLGRTDEARGALLQAAALARSDREKKLMEERAAALGQARGLPSAPAKKRGTTPLRSIQSQYSR
ncbi:MAG: polymerase subunit sigma-24 [Sphingomonas bacterium]|uniref:RNA polymerase sigma factor n=1 Tax=Sphingomonas bacterium TaxID=1895847 RepID=UPI002635D15F|nr:RNA polymerase sigma factor [Sphingomonas bacterium]MDB5706118.1 polymerase subunit sigma-24 [Sphingomonas bacterium]